MIAEIVKDAHQWHHTHRLARAVVVKEGANPPSDGRTEVYCTACQITEDDHKRRRELCVKIRQEEFYYHNEPRTPWILKKLRCFEFTRHEWRFAWGEVTWSWGLALSLSSFAEGWSLHIHPLFGSWYIKLPRVLPHKGPKDGGVDTWGFTSWWDTDLQGVIQLSWGPERSFSLEPFWRWQGHCRELLLKDGTWHREDLRGDVSPETLYSETFPYRYCTSNYEIQTVQATVTVDRSTIRRRFLSRWPYFEKTQTWINIKFDDEVGERRGSWKGGVLGCSYEMRDCESPRETLLRMERTRKFR